MISHIYIDIFQSASLYSGIIDNDEDEEGSADGGDFSEYGCSYCGLCDPACVVKSVDSNKWFCNGRGNTSASHIIQVGDRPHHVLDNSMVGLLSDC